jgi:hypothetical protein
MFDGRLDVGRFTPRGKHVSNHFFPRKSRESQGLHKFLSRCRHNDLHANPAVCEQAQNLRCLISRNPAADAKSNLHNFQPTCRELVFDRRLWPRQ